MFRMITMRIMILIITMMDDDDDDAGAEDDDEVGHSAAVDGSCAHLRML